MGKPKKSLHGVREFEKIKVILKQHGVKKAGVFGSWARGEQKKNSDIDLLVEVGETWTLTDLVRLKRTLEQASKSQVDLVEYSCIHPYLKKDILNQEVELL